MDDSDRAYFRDLAAAVPGVREIVERLTAEQPIPAPRQFVTHAERSHPND